jgi:glycolate oxidase iron-sulfur subunit
MATAVQTRFSRALLADADMAASEAVIRKCVHCGFCTATCPTYVLLGDELDSPRGRIYLMKEMLENERQPTAETVKHIDRCLSCLSCMTTCPSGVNYMHLVDHARTYIEKRYKRPLIDRLFRGLLAAVLPYPGRFRLALALARLARPLAPAFAATRVLNPLAAMLNLAPQGAARHATTYASPAPMSKGRVALLQGCAEPVLRPEIRDATVRLLNRVGYDVVFAPEEGCCGALTHHLGREEAALASARRNVDAWSGLADDGLDAVVITASGCASIDLPASNGRGLRVAYHAACSLQHGQKVNEQPQALLKAAGFEVLIPAEAHLCCGSAGTYNILQPEIASQLGDRKTAALMRLKPDVIATGNIGCATQIGVRAGSPVLHIVELLDWATGGPAPTSICALVPDGEFHAPHHA